MPRILRRLKINEVSSVDRGAGEGVHIMLMKRDDELDDETLAYLKREFSAEQRREAASSGAALPDGSFPIHNKSDLHNAMRAIGRAKDPAKAKAHIRRRAKALGLSGDLTDAFKRATWSEFFADLFTREPEPAAEQTFDQALAGLAESVKSIINDDDADTDDMLAKSFAQFHEHVSPLIGDRASPRQPTDKKGDPIMSAILKALGLKEDASEEDALKAIADLAKARRKEEDKEEEDEEEEEEEEEREHEKRRRRKEEDEEEEEKALQALPARVRKRIAANEETAKRVQKLEDEAALAGFTKRAVESGLPATEGATLQQLFKTAPDAAEKMLTLTKSALAAAREAGAFKEFGTSGGNGGGTAFEQFTSMAQKYLRDHPGEKLSESQAFTKVYEDPANAKLRVQDARETGRAAS
jgi:hypothetical protein